jgi:hypothetical protein
VPAAVIPNPRVAQHAALMTSFASNAASCPLVVAEADCDKAQRPFVFVHGTYGSGDNVEIFFYDANGNGQSDFAVDFTASFIDGTDPVLDASQLRFMQVGFSAHDDTAETRRSKVKFRAGLLGCTLVGDVPVIGSRVRRLPIKGKIGAKSGRRRGGALFLQC